ncbi:hypothetical protein LPB86_12225 [Pedobacter sp. MC2016-14]|uniref:hypothetical protein n=1 Tax=Pedobacter sp. MC2016-14 TaxID=2897327 RepID=UPI001E414E6C|nr:hypothetical protein [Pedobacter sp. MC2016-14]MCD0488997.1 hypothetical protein [Pedobacter sp. MC2016-14]
MHHRLRHLLSPLFICCLALLILNDFLLKATFHNMLTGKLSDFCGLFIFPIFWSAVFPRQKIWVFVFTGLLFVWWKSEYASGFIEQVNTIFSIQRTVDATDLIALSMLLLGWFYIKTNPKVVIVVNSLLTRLSALFIGAVAIFSFCATTQQRYIQSFDQPQYVLLCSTVLPDPSLYEGFEFYKKDSLLVVEVNQMFIAKPVMADDYNKNRSVKDLDEAIREQISDSTSLIPPGKVTNLAINTAWGTDALRFNGGRLDGRFSRTKNSQLIIEGFYKMGLEDSTWTTRDSSGTKVLIQTFVNGERTSVKQYSRGKLVSSGSVNTRADTIRIKYIQIGILVLLVAVTILLLIRNFRSTFPEQLKLKQVWKWLLCFISPIFVWLIHFGIRILLMDYNQDFFVTLATIVFIFMVTCPLMSIVVFWINLRKETDILLYCLLFGLIYSIWTSCGTLIALHN